VSNSCIKVVEEIFEFLGLMGFDPAVVNTMLSSWINSLLDRTGQADSFPRWQNWSCEQVKSFENFAGRIMARLGYY
ncbi:MAG: hypothetical protein ACFFCW_47980, partial [Candidatus Hodarchaeota archaeon]